MEIHYIISKYKGEYEAHFEFSNTKGFQANLARAVGAEIVYQGTLRDDPKIFWNTESMDDEKLNLIQKFVKEANEIKKFDPKKLEEILRQG